MLRSFARTMACVALGLALCGCPGFGDETLGDDIDATPTWEGQVRQVFERHCWSCHGETPCCSAPFSLFTYEQVIDVKGLVEEQVVISNGMPPGVGLPEEPRAIIGAWLAGGAPRGDAASDGGPVPDAAPSPDLGPLPDGGAAPTWNGDIGPLFAARCATEFCHVGSPPQGGLDLSTYEGFQAGGFGGDLTGGGDPAMSLVVKRLRGIGGTRMPLTGDPLSEAQIRLVERWIAAGAPRGE